MRVTLLRAADRVKTPWKNGGGVTETIASWPADAALDDFEWRVSMARIDAAGPFSRFPGVDRVLAVLDGRLRLGSVELDAASPPFAFSGDEDIVCAPTDGPVRVLNLMTRRGFWRGRVSNDAEAGDLVMLFAKRAFATTVGSLHYSLDVGDALLLEKPSDGLPTPLGDAVCISLQRDVR